MLRYLVVILLLAGCTGKTATIVDFEPTNTKDEIVITDSLGNFITGPEVLGTFTRGTAVTFDGSRLCSGGKCIDARRDR